MNPEDSCENQAFFFLQKIKVNKVKVSSAASLLGCLRVKQIPFYELSYRKNSKIWDTSNNCHDCPKIGKV